MHYKLNDDVLLEILTDALGPQVADILRQHHPGCDSIVIDGEVKSILMLVGDWINRDMEEPVVDVTPVEEPVIITTTDQESTGETTITPAWTTGTTKHEDREEPEIVSFN
jgi:hypothetical protein